MANLVFSVVFVALLFASAHSLGFGSCPKVQVVQNFDINGFLGKWYEYSKYYSAFEGFAQKCITNKYDLSSDGSVSVLNKYISDVDETPFSTQSSVRVSDGKLIADATYSILGTDYENFAVVSSCTSSFALLNSEYLWIYTRERYPSKETIAAAQNVINKNKLSLGDMRATNQLDCPANH